MSKPRVVPVPPKSAARLALDDLLADGGWHGVDEAIAAMVGHIEPGKAYREGERRRLAGVVDGSVAGGRRSRGDEATAVAAGRRSKAREVLRRAVRDGKVSRVGDAVRAAR